jgi:hypothetical protein
MKTNLMSNVQFNSQQTSTILSPLTPVSPNMPLSLINESNIQVLRNLHHHPSIAAAPNPDLYL